MNNYDEIIMALRCNANCDKFFNEHNFDCTDCPMPHRNDTQRMCVDFDTTVLPQSADALTELCAEVEWLKESSKIIDDKAKEVSAENKALRNELCYKCGRYREAHNGACNGCKWRKE